MCVSQTKGAHAFEVLILKSVEERLSHTLDYLFLPVNEQLSQTAQWDIHCQFYPSLSLGCFVECSQTLFK